MRELPLEDALQLVQLYAEKECPKYERAALRWLKRYLAEGEPSLQLFARTVVRLVELRTDRGVAGERMGALPGPLTTRKPDPSPDTDARAEGDRYERTCALALRLGVLPS